MNFSLAQVRATVEPNHLLGQHRQTLLGIAQPPNPLRAVEPREEFRFGEGDRIERLADVAPNPHEVLPQLLLSNPRFGLLPGQFVASLRLFLDRLADPGDVAREVLAAEGFQIGKESQFHFEITPSVPIMGETTASLVITVEGKEVEG
jgi:hypothetical protein